MRRRIVGICSKGKRESKCDAKRDERGARPFELSNIHSAREAKGARKSV